MNQAGRLGGTFNLKAWKQRHRHKIKYSLAKKNLKVKRGIVKTKRERVVHEKFVTKRDKILALKRERSKRPQWEEREKIKFESNLFSCLPIDDRLKEVLKNEKLYEMTPVQSEILSETLAWKDVLFYTKESDMELTYILNSVQSLIELEFKKRHAVGAIYIFPNRESAEKAYDLVRKLTANTPLTSGILLDSSDVATNASRLCTGLNIVIANPNRLLFHLTNTKNLRHANVRCFAIHEADMLLKLGFGQTLLDISKFLTKRKQTIVFSKTNIPEVQELASQLMRRNKIVTIHNISKDESIENENSFVQNYIVTECDERIAILLSLLRQYKGKKVVVRFSTINEVKFYSEIFRVLKIETKKLFTNQKKNMQNSILQNFKTSNDSFLFTDSSYFLSDIENLSLVIQYSVPYRLDDYAKQLKSLGSENTKKIIFLLPSEKEKFLKEFESLKISVSKMKEAANRERILPTILDSVTKVYSIYMLGWEAYKSYLEHYASNSTFDVKKVNLRKLSSTFGLTKPPRVNFDSFKPKQNAKDLIETV